MIKDILLNLVASIMYTAVSQILVYPFLGRLLDASKYGQILALMGVANAVGVTIGSPLNNIRLLQNQKYLQMRMKGDFQRIFFVGAFVCFVLTILLASVVTGELSYPEVLLSVIAFSVMYRSYYSVDYRININYWLNLGMAITSSLGYLCGIMLGRKTNEWVLVFVVGEIAPVLFLLATAKTTHEPTIQTPLFQETQKKYLSLLAATSLSSSIVYLDRFLLFPILGAEVVTAYSVASFSGKILGIFLGPVSGVLLTYYAIETGITSKIFRKRVAYFITISIVTLLVVLAFGPQLIKHLYPDYFTIARPYFELASIASILYALGSAIQPTMLRYCHEKWQLRMQIVFVFLYIIVGTILMRAFELYGFVYAVLITNSFRVLFIIIVTNRSIQKYQKEIESQ